MKIPEGMSYQDYHIKTWRSLDIMAETNDVVGFFVLYLEYLENSKVESKERATLLKISKAIAFSTKVTGAN